MARIAFLWAVVLVSILVFMQGSSAVTPVFVQKGKDVLLEVKENVVLKETDILFWRFNQTSILVRLTPGKNLVIFKESVSFLTNYSVKLKNLQAADSGVYDARVIGATERKLVEYNITVQEYAQSPTNGIAIGFGTVSGVVFILAVAVAGLHRQKRRQYDTENHENTIYATPQVETSQTRDESPPSDASCVSPTSTYSLVGLHSRPAEARDNPLPESLYATVDKPAKTEKPARPCKNLQEL